MVQYNTESTMFLTMTSSIMNLQIYFLQFTYLMISKYKQPLFATVLQRANESCLYLLI
jgi:hypothetical protein